MVHKFLLTLLIMVSVFMELQAAVDVSGSGRFVSASQLDLPVDGVDDIVFTDGSAVSLTYSTSRASALTWYSYTSSFSSATQVAHAVSADRLSVSAQPDHAYVIQARSESGEVTESRTIWVFDMNNYRMTALSIDTLPSEDPCASLPIRTRALVPTIQYATPEGAVKSVERIYCIVDTSFVWDGTALSEQEVLDSITTHGGTSVEEKVTYITPPYRNTGYSLRGDVIQTALNMPSVVSANYIDTAVAVTCHLHAEILERDGRNEQDRTLEGTSASSFGGSAPLHVSFTSNANIPVARYFDWFIINNEHRNDSSIVYHDADLRYVFNETGVYTVLLRVRNVYDTKTGAYCLKQDSITVTVSESDLQVPSAFSPNGDGVNDEFRVSYKSLKKFHCWVYNRWGHQIYDWTDPSKGWDGTVDGRKCPTGPYYYIIEAEGTDHRASGRRKEYRLKGDVNLFR
jgi:gliding motility-associated-like protein